MFSLTMNLTLNIKLWKCTCKGLCFGKSHPALLPNNVVRIIFEKFAFMKIHFPFPKKIKEQKSEMLQASCCHELDLRMLFTSASLYLACKFLKHHQNYLFFPLSPFSPIHVVTSSCSMIVWKADQRMMSSLFDPKHTKKKAWKKDVVAYH